ncbi:uncharacterized protein [Lolium perenne]|uniref:uncharacterized protein n=1 Tax=Lolium perenne TaxID=4522 RepID=UPI0021F5F7A0|nr:uncharacterized protein LOC127347968 [Lolium perenne]
MDMNGFTEEDLMAALSHLVDHKAQGSSFVGMNDPHRTLWVRNYLANTTTTCSGALEGVGGDACMKAQQEYQSFLDDEAMSIEAIDKLVPLAQLPSEAVPALQGAPEVRERRVKDFITVFLIVVIVRIFETQIKGKGDDPTSAAGGASGPPGSKSVGASLGVALVLDQYGSNLSASAEVLPSLPLLDSSKLMPGVQSDHLGAIEESLESGEMESHLTDPLASWVEDSQQAEGPPAKVARRSLPSPPPAVGVEGVELVEMETVDESDVEEQVVGGDLRAEVAVATPIAQGPRSKAVYFKRGQSTPASAVRKSARNSSVAPGTSALARAQQLTAEKNLEGKTAPASAIGKEKVLEGSGQTEGPAASGRGAGRG